MRPRPALLEALDDAAAQADRDGEELGPAELLRALIEGIRRSGCDGVTADELEWILEDLTGPPWPA